MKEIRVPIQGMHCRACEITIGDNLKKIPGVQKCRVSLDKKEAVIHASRPVPERKLQSAIRKAGYEIGADQTPWISKNTTDWRDVLISAVIIITLLLIAQVTGLTDINAASMASQGIIVALVVGLTAGLSTCMALVGGLVLGLSARHAEKHPEASPLEKFRPHLFFNSSRIVTFFLLGGLMGLFGSLFQLSGLTLGILMILVGVVMLVLGLQLTHLFPRISSSGLTLPPVIAQKLGLHTTSNEYHHKNAVTLGAISFFLPCGFTQAMQVYAVSTGSFVTGALVMGLFAMGTTPGLLGIGGLTSALRGQFAQRFFRFAGVAVIAFAVLNIHSGFTLTGWKNRLTSFSETVGLNPYAEFESLSSIEPIQGEVSEDNILHTTFEIPEGARLVGLVGDISPNTFDVNTGETYTLRVDSRNDGIGCMSTMLIPGLVNEFQFLQADTIHDFTFTAKRPGRYSITCAMGIPFGTINVR